VESFLTEYYFRLCEKIYESLDWGYCSATQSNNNSRTCIRIFYKKTFSMNAVNDRPYLFTVVWKIKHKRSVNHPSILVFNIRYTFRNLDKPTIGCMYMDVKSCRWDGLEYMCHLVVCFKDGTHIHPDIAFLGMLPVEKEKKLSLTSFADCRPQYFDTTIKLSWIYIF
jgi:hypothetical protein